MLNEWILPCLWASFGTLGFGFIYKMRSCKLIFITLGGALTWLVYLLMMHWNFREYLAYAAAAGVGTLYSECMARAVKTPVTAFIIPVNIPMIPGGSLFYAFWGLMEGDTARFLEKGKYALFVSGAMALGIFVATMLFRMIKGGIDTLYKSLKRKAAEA